MDIKLNDASGPLSPPHLSFVNGCTLSSVYDLREGDEGSSDLYDDDWAFRRPRSNSSDFLILRKTSRPLSVDVVGLVDSQSDPYRQYMRVVDCYELAPPTGNVIALDKSIKVLDSSKIGIRLLITLLYCASYSRVGMV
ncbi:hypothetical protein NECAME_07576 [Necator americanus]|uniref:Uncharacterized protein n=1 Tax=Necator americanus TaxID=51031 RepID=W2TPP4_NECAM|nr:hypothetical protein NECAME_07576 [Necator americanus]ETN83106.1 hypothetical protein NECAME_07576 [Necator americanus]